MRDFNTSDLQARLEELRKRKGNVDPYQQKRDDDQAEKLERKINQIKSVRRKVIGGIGAGVIVLGGLFTFAACTVNIDPGYAGIVYSLKGGIQGDTLSQGLNTKAPWHKVTSYSVATEQGYLSADSKEGSKGDDSFLIPTSDGKTVNVDLEYSYHFDAEKLPETFTKFKGQNGKQIEETFMRGKLKTWAGEVSSKYSVLDIYGNKRTELNADVYQYVKNKFEQYGIVVDSISFSRIGLDAQTEAAIQERINAQQGLEKEKVETEKAKQIQERKEIEAQTAANVKLIEAQAEADANKKISESMTPELLKKMELEARQKHGWVSVQGAGSVIVDDRKAE